MNRRLMLSALLLTSSTLLWQNTVFARSTKLVDPERVEWDCKLTMKQAERAIKTGLRNRGWTHKTKKPGHWVGRLVVRNKHTLWVDINYGTRSFDIDYKDSDNLNYKVKDDGTRYLHPNAVSWMNNLRNDIRNAAYDLCP